MTRSLLAGLALMAAGLLASVLAPARAEAEGPAASVSPLTSSALASGVQAQVVSGAPEPAVFIGLVLRDEDGVLATKVRALGANGAVCGTASVVTLGSGDGFYQLAAVGAETREGCPREGGALAFRLLYGSIDNGSFAITSQAVRFASGQTSIVSLTPPPTSSDVDWIGEIPRTGDAALLTWVGVDGTPITEALDALGTPVHRVSHYDADRARWVSYTVGGPSFLQTYTVVHYGDVVRVRF